MGETLIQRCRVYEEGVNCKVLLLVTMMTVAREKAPANSVPAAAVIQGVLALFGMTGRKGCVGCYVSRM